MTAITTKQLCVRGYHVYKDVGQLLLAKSWCVEEKMKLPQHLCCISNEIYDERCRRWPLAQENIAHCFTVPYERWNDPVSSACDWCSHVSKRFQF